MNIALSTCWNSHRHEDGYAMLKEIADLGFTHAELSHGVRVSLVAGILKAIDEGIIQISSVHNFCPLPMGVNVAAPNVYQPTASSKQEKILWFRNTLKTIDFAERVKAKAMVIHSGSVRFLWGAPGEKLEAAFKDTILGQDEVEEATRTAFERLGTKTVRKLRRRARRPLKRLVEAYESVVEAATQKGIRIGVENREGVEELPLDREMKDLLAQLEKPEIFGYWHDAGHAQLKHHLGLLDHEEMLSENAERQLGFHLHDVSVKNRDHCEIGTGVVDWQMVRRFIKPQHIVTLELSPRLSPEAIQRSKAYVEANVLPS